MNPLSQLLELAQQKDDLETAIVRTVAAARADGASWQAIANKIGGTKQAAQQRYGKRIEELPLSDPIFDPLFTTPQVHTDDTDAGQLDGQTAIFLDGMAPATGQLDEEKPLYDWQDPAPRRTAAAWVELDHDSEADMNRVESGELDTGGNTIDWTGRGAPKCLYCGKTHHYDGKGKNLYFWIYPGCNPTTRDRSQHH